MRGFSAKLPLSVDPIDGIFCLNKTSIEGIKQNLKMIILTNPGERIMIPEFGVGLKKMLFEQNTSENIDLIKFNISDQVSRYLPVVAIRDIIIFSSEENANSLNVRIIYHIPVLRASDVLDININ
jgi:phage baseplate assembly protein W